MAAVRVEVRAGDCPCPGSPHSTEWVDIMAELDLPTAAGALAAVQHSVAEEAAVQAALIRAYLPAAIVGWSFLGGDGTGAIIPVPVTRANMDRLVPWSKGGMALAARCDELYSEELLRPLQEATSKSLPLGQTADSMSAIPASGSQDQTPSEPSSLPTTDGMPSVVPAR